VEKVDGVSNGDKGEGGGGQCWRWFEVKIVLDVEKVSVASVKVGCKLVVMVEIKW
jgi:hypothetical protein